MVSQVEKNHYLISSNLIHVHYKFINHKSGLSITLLQFTRLEDPIEASTSRYTLPNRGNLYNFSVCHISVGYTHSYKDCQASL